MRYVIVSDIHANHEALQAVDQTVKRWRTKQDARLPYWFLGDVLGYGPDPVECLRWLRYTSRIGKRWVAGNHDVEVLRLAAGGSGKGATLRAVESWRRHLELLQQPENSSWWKWFSTQIQQITDNEERSMVIETHGDLACIFVHGSVNAAARRTQYLYPWAPDHGVLQADLQRLWDQYGKEHRTVCLLHGHTHYPILAALNPDRTGIRYRSIVYGEPMPLGEGCIGINPGSVGQPRDGDPRASFAILDTEAHTITFHRVMYDIYNTVKKLEKARCPQSLIRLLTTANGGAHLTYYRTIYRAPELHHLPAIGPVDSKQ